jgi:hypothetical protein
MARLGGPQGWQFTTGRLRWPATAARALAAAGIVLAVAGCSGVTPLGPDPAATLPQPGRLRSPVTMEAMRSQPLSPKSGCPAGWVALPVPGPAGVGSACYGQAGTPVTSTSAGVTPVSAYRPPPPPGAGAAVPGGYAFTIVLPAADAAALTAVATMVTGPQAGTSPSSPAGPAFAVSVAGHTWLLDEWAGQVSKARLQVIMPTRNQALQLQRLLSPPG